MAKAQTFNEMNTNTLQCRSLGHAWLHQASFSLPQSLVELHFLCGRCKCARRDEWDRRTGEVVTRVYKHPDRYLVRNVKKEWGGRQLLNANVRIELVGRIAKKAPRRSG